MSPIVKEKRIFWERIFGIAQSALAEINDAPSSLSVHGDSLDHVVDAMKSEQVLLMRSSELRKMQSGFMIGDVVVNRNLAEHLADKIHQPVCEIVASLALTGKSEAEISEAAKIAAQVIAKTLTSVYLDMASEGISPHVAQ